jgi:hypothetical protein
MFSDSVFRDSMFSDSVARDGCWQAWQRSPCWPRQQVAETIPEIRAIPEIRVRGR